MSASGEPRNVMVVVNLWEPWVRGTAAGISRFAAATPGWRLTRLSPAMLPANPATRPAGVVGTLYPAETHDWIHRVPSVSLFPDGPIPPQRTVCTDPVAGGEVVARHFLDRDIPHHRVVMAPLEAPARLARVQAFERVATQAGRPPKRYTPRVRWDRPPSRPQLTRLADWLSQQPRPMGLMAVDDNFGALAIQACHHAGLRVPDDVAIVGSNNDQPICDFCQPAMSSVAHDQLRIGYEAAALLDRLMRGEPEPAGPTLIPPLGIVTRASSDVQHTDSRAVSMAIRFIRDHIADLSPADVADHCHVSARTLQRHFLRYRGHTLGAEILQARLRKVEQLLLASDAPLAEVADNAGYSHLSQMCREFKAGRSLTPTQYRRRYRSLHG